MANDCGLFSPMFAQSFIKPYSNYYYQFVTNLPHFSLIIYGFAMIQEVACNGLLFLIDICHLKKERKGMSKRAIKQMNLVSFNFGRPFPLPQRKICPFIY